MTDSWGRTFEEDVLARGAEDWVHSLELVNAAGDHGVSAIRLRMFASIGVLSSLVAHGLARLGDVRGGFRPWSLTPAEAVERVTREWAELRDPSEVMPGEVCWLDVTASGEAIGRAVWAREEASGLRDHDDGEDEALAPRQPVDTTNARGRTFEEDVLARAARHSVAPSELLGSAADQGVADPGMRRYVVIGLLSSLVTRRLATLGAAVTEDEPQDNYGSWDLSPAESVARVTCEWMLLDDPDNEAADALFRVEATPAGRDAARAVLTREDGPGAQASV